MDTPWWVWVAVAVMVLYAVWPGIPKPPRWGH